MGQYYEELISSDWLGRSQEDYSYEKRGLSSGWEDSLKSGQAFSSFLIDITEKPEVIKVEQKVLLTKQLCNSIKNTLLIGRGLDKDTIITFCDEFKNYASKNGNLICVTLQPLAQDKIKLFPTVNHAIDPILGFTTHEIAHILYTTEEYDEYLMNMKGIEANLKGCIMNVLEDERIEREIAHNFRGFSNYLGKSKDYAFGLNYEEEKTKIKDHMEEDINQLVNSFILLVRYPKALDEEMVNKFGKELKEIQTIIGKEIPSNIKGLTEITDQIYEVFLRFLDEQEQGGAGQSGGDNEESDDGGEQESNGNAISQMDGGNVSSNGGGNGSQTKKGGQQNSGMSREQLVQLLQDLTEGLQQALVNAIPQGAKTLDELKSTLGTKEFNRYGVEKAIRDISTYNNEQLDKTMSRTHSFPELRNLGVNEMSVSYLYPEKDFVGSRNNYGTAYKEVISYATSLRAKLMQLNRNTEVTYTGLLEGDFDDALLVDNIIGARNVYKETHIIKNMGACVGLLIDESGSMGDDDNWFDALKIAIMFERALDGLNSIDFYCYGHTTGTDNNSLPDSTLIKTYFEGRRKGNRKNLGYIYNHNTNRDGHALLETVTRIRQNIDIGMPLVMFMISDGEPSASVPNGYSQKGYLKKVVDTLEKDLNTTIIHIAIHSGIQSETMFNHYVKFTNFNTLVRDVGNLLRKTIEKRQAPIMI